MFDLELHENFRNTNPDLSLFPLFISSHLYNFIRRCRFCGGTRMNTLTYYKQYRSLSDRASMLEGQLQFFFDDYNRSETLKELHRISNLKKEIERNLENYIPYALPPKHYYRALEEREFLFYRYIKGFMMLQVAELMCVSRDTVYRIQRRIAARDGLFSSVLDDA